jgi:radical SAM superfamily enzyme YgiQ (UPF0313 family)
VKKLLLINPWNRVSLYGDYAWEPLSLGYVAACVGPDWEVELVDEQITGLVDYARHDADLVGVTAFTTQATRAYAIAAQFRARKIPVVMGGIHASLVTDEALGAVDTVCTGECESAFPRLLADFDKNALERVYAGSIPAPGSVGLRPDRRIFAPGVYRYASAQTTRGCPMDCSFCSVTAFNGRAFRMRQVDDVIGELQSIAARDVILVDDDLNGFSRRAKERCLDLFRSMIAADLTTRSSRASRARRAAPASSSGSRAPTRSRSP